MWWIKPRGTEARWARLPEERLAQAIETMAQSLLVEAECASCLTHTITDTTAQHPTPLIHQALGVVSGFAPKMCQQAARKCR